MRPLVPVKPPTRPASETKGRLRPRLVQARLGIGPGTEPQAQDGEERLSLPSPAGSGSSSFTRPRRPRPLAQDKLPDSVVELRKRVVAAASRLSVVAHKLGLVLVESEADCEEVRRLGFAGLWTRSDLTDGSMSGADLCQQILALHTGDDVQPLADCVRIVARTAPCPPCMALIFRPGRQPSRDYEQELVDTQVLFHSGADDVVSISDASKLTVHRVMVSLFRTNVMLADLQRRVEEHPTYIKATRSLQSLATRMLWELPGDFLEYIPRDQVVAERTGNACSIGMYRLLYELGAGAFGTVFKAQHIESGAVRAIKITPKKQIQSIRELASLNQELCLLKGIEPHPNVTHAYEALHSRDNIAIVMNFGGELNMHAFILQTLEDRHIDALPVDMVESFCKQAAAGVAHLHSWSACHRDIKPRNFIVNAPGERLVLVDFGFACLVRGPNHRLQSRCGSLPFVAPEVLRLWDEKGSKGYNGIAADVWSLALNMVEICLGLYTVEKMLGWTPSPPARSADQAQDLVMFPFLCKTGPRIPVPCVDRVLEEMLRVNFEDRASMQWLVGPEGLDLSGGD